MPGQLDSSMHDRTHKGGAVLWFMRKHSPMPPTLFDSAPVEVPDASKKVRRMSGSGNTRGAVLPDTATPQGSAKLQAKFLHEALLSIGVEMDEDRTARQGSVSQSARHRDELRRTFQAHSDLECQRLRRRLSAREAELRALRLQVEQTERLVQATRSAAARRSVRLRVNASSSANPLLLTQGLMKSKQRLLAAAADMVWDADDDARFKTSDSGNSKEPKDLTYEESLQAKVNSQFDAEQALRATLESQIRAFEQQTVRRKVVEAGLFGTQAEILSLRSQALHMESRVTKLANSLRRVYKQLPEVFEQKLVQSAPQLQEEKEKELQAIRSTNYAEHLKWLSSEELQQHAQQCEADIHKNTEKAKRIEEAMVDSPTVLRHMLEKLKASTVAAACLREAWHAVTSRSGSIANKDSLTYHENVQGQVEDMELRIRSLLEAVVQRLAEELGEEELGELAASRSESDGLSGLVAA